MLPRLHPTITRATLGLVIVVAVSSTIFSLKILLSITASQKIHTERHQVHHLHREALVREMSLAVSKPPC